MRIVVVGRDRRDPLCLAADEYVERVKRYRPIEVVEVKEIPLTKHRDIAEVKREEAARLQERLQPGERVVALDERGKVRTSEEIAKHIERLELDAHRTLTFVIGGPSGLDPDFVQRADERWALSKLTLPHRLARLVLSEQLYRAMTILRGEPYHK